MEELSFTFIDDTQPNTLVWKEILSEFRDDRENVIREHTRTPNVIAQPFQKVSADNSEQITFHKWRTVGQVLGCSAQ